MMRSVAHQAGGTAFNAAVGFALLVFLGRTLEPATFARYVVLVAATAVCVVAVSGGNGNWLYRAGVAEAHEANRARTAAPIAQVCVTTALLVTAALLFSGIAAALAMMCAGALALIDLVSVQLRAQGEFAREAAWQAACRAASALAIVCVVLWSSPRVDAIFAAWLVSAAVLLSLVAKTRLARPAFSSLPAHVTVVAPILAVDALLALASKGDVAVLALRVPAAELADYAACSRFVEAAILAFAPVINVQLRYLRLRRADPAEFASTWRRTAGAALGAGVAAIVASACFGEFVVPAVFGPGYAEAGSLLVWLALALPFLLANLVLAQAMLAAGRERPLARVLAIGIAAWLAALLSSPEFGLRTAMIGVAFAHAAVMFALARMLSRSGS